MKEAVFLIIDICDICLKFEFWKNVIKLKESAYETDIPTKCTTSKSDWVFKSCHNSLMKNKMLVQPQLNNMELCPKISELDRLCPLLDRLLFIVAKTKGA